MIEMINLYFSIRNFCFLFFGASKRAVLDFDILKKKRDVKVEVFSFGRKDGGPYFLRKQLRIKLFFLFWFPIIWLN